MFFFLMIRRPPRSTPFPTRRSSDLSRSPARPVFARSRQRDRTHRRKDPPGGGCSRAKTGDRKSTRLNSSHQIISYAVFCLKKKMGIADICTYINDVNDTPNRLCDQQ